MRAKGAALLAVSAAAIGILAAKNCFLNINGSRISEILKTGDSSIIKVIKTIETPEKTFLINQSVLDDRQKEMLILFFENTNFKRTLIKTMPFNEVERVIVTAATIEKNVFFRLESYGGEYVVVDSSLKSAPANHWKLRIQNYRWENFLEEIMT